MSSSWQLIINAWIGLLFTCPSVQALAESCLIKADSTVHLIVWDYSIRPYLKCIARSLCSPKLSSFAHSKWAWCYNLLKTGKQVYKLIHNQLPPTIPVSQNYSDTATGIYYMNSLTVTNLQHYCTRCLIVHMLFTLTCGHQCPAAAISWYVLVE